MGAVGGGSESVEREITWDDIEDPPRTDPTPPQTCIVPYVLYIQCSTVQRTSELLTSACFSVSCPDMDFHSAYLRGHCRLLAGRGVVGDGTKILEIHFIVNRMRRSRVGMTVIAGIGEINQLKVKEGQIQQTIDWSRRLVRWYCRGRLDGTWAILVCALCVR